jgi:hypothetical protein
MLAHDHFAAANARWITHCSSSRGCVLIYDEASYCEGSIENMHTLGNVCEGTHGVVVSPTTVKGAHILPYL